MTMPFGGAPTDADGIPHLHPPAGTPFGWLADAAPWVKNLLPVHGAVLVHGLPIRRAADLAEARQALGVRPYTTTEVFAHRRNLGDGVLSPIRWPHDRVLCPYQEEAFSTVFPGTVLTACVAPPEHGGQAHLSDARRLTAHLPTGLVARARADGWSMTRVFHDRFGMPWQEAFAVADPDQLSEVLTAEGIEHRWSSEGALRTVRRRPAMITHPVTGEECWFNQIAFLNAGSLEPCERALLVEAFGPDLPVDTAFGDGTPLSEEELAFLHSAYDATTLAIPWAAGDLLITGNILMALGRSPGAPELLITLGDPMDPQLDRSGDTA